MNKYKKHSVHLGLFAILALTALIMFQYSLKSVAMDNTSITTLNSDLPTTTKDTTINDPVSDDSTSDGDSISVNEILTNTADTTGDSPVLNTTSDKTTLDTSSTKDSNIDVTPEANFVKPSNRETLRDYATIELEVKEANNVELYLIALGSNTLKYIGNAKEIKDNHWDLNFNSNSFPNGSFYLKAKIKNDYGTYESSRITINIDNGIAQSIQQQTARNQTINATDEPQIERKEQLNKYENTNGFNDLTSQQWQNKFFKQSNCQNENICGGNADPDKDGITNNEEFRYNTDH